MAYLLLHLLLFLLSIVPFNSHSIKRCPKQDVVIVVSVAE